MTSVKLSNGGSLQGEELKNVLKNISEDYKKTVYKIFEGDDWASHITEEDKKKYLEQELLYASEIELGLHNNNFTIWQKINLYCTGESVPFMV